METHLIDCPNAWDAVQTVRRAFSQVWSESIAVMAPKAYDYSGAFADSLTSDMIYTIMTSPAMVMIDRVEKRILESWRKGDLC